MLTKFDKIPIYQIKKEQNQSNDYSNNIHFILSNIENNIDKTIIRKPVLNYGDKTEFSSYDIKNIQFFYKDEQNNTDDDIPELIKIQEDKKDNTNDGLLSNLISSIKKYFE